MGIYKIGDVLVGPHFHDGKIDDTLVYIVLGLINSRPIVTVAQDLLSPYNNSFQCKGFEGQEISFADAETHLIVIHNIDDNTQEISKTCSCDSLTLFRIGCECGGT